MPKQPVPLDYSCPAREGQEERDRREALESYNLSTFGERRPVVTTVIGLAVLLLVLSALAFVLSRRMMFVADLIGFGGFLAWRWYRER